MAHKNINERRAYVEALLMRGALFNTARMREVGALFGCSGAAIHADIIAITTADMAESRHISAAQRLRILARDNAICQYCGALDPMRIIEHVIPAALRGVARDYNLVVACASCNVRKRRAIWIPRNLDSITAGQPAWRAAIIARASRDCR
jgi:hypothetical protein